MTPEKSSRKSWKEGQNPVREKSKLRHLSNEGLKGAGRERVSYHTVRSLGFLPILTKGRRRTDSR